MRFFGARRLVLAVTAILMLIGSAVYASQMQRIDAFEVRVDGRVVATVAQAEMVDQAVEHLLGEARRAARLDVAVVNRPQVQAVRVPRDHGLADVDQLVAVLRPRLRYVTQGVAVRVNGRDVVVLATQAEAQQVLARLLDQVRDRIAQTGSPSVQVQVQELTFVERVELVPVAVDPARVRSVDDAVAILQRGTDAVREHTVRKGDTLYAIARRAGLSIQSLLRANPQLTNPHRLRVGQTVNLVVPKPYVTVRSVERQTRVLEVPYPTQVRRDPDMWPWERRVERPGVPGRKQVVEDVVRVNGAVVERTLVSTRVLAEPVPELVTLGGKVAPNLGTGALRWPMDLGRISSWFGRRGRDWHTGVDIAAPTGTPARAADRGVVVLAGWYGAYGRTVMVDHGGGRLMTLYGHLSRVAVRVGQSVEKGQVIGYVGCTGRCTGPHLHFEVRENGRPVNPLRFYR